MKIHITESELKQIINNTVTNILQEKDLLTEMSIPLKDYKEKAESLRFQIVENWCLCKYCQLYDNNNTNFNHWLGELRAYINKLKFLNIKNNINKKQTLIKLYIEDFDLNDNDMIYRIMEDKFYVEKIEDNEIKIKVCEEFVANINSLIEVISNPNISTLSYMQAEFNLEY